MTTYHPTGDRLVFTAPVYGNAVSRTLDELIGIDAPPVRVSADGTIDTDTAHHSPDLEGGDPEIKASAAVQGWELLSGYSGQYGYQGPVMHPSEFIGGRMADDILSTPGVYVAVAVDGAFGLPVDAAAGLPTGWVVARWVGRPERRAVPLPLESYVGPTSSTPRAIAARALASAAHTLRPAGVIIPETPASARREYVAARERGETVDLALTRARLEMVTDAVLSPTRDFSGWHVDAVELSRVTRSPELDALSGTVRDAATGERLLFPVDIPDGIRLTVSTERDLYSDRVATEECYSPEDRKAWTEDEWEFRTVVVTATDADGNGLAEASLGGVEVGDYWPGTEPAQLWPHVPELAREVLACLPDDAHDGCAACEAGETSKHNPEIRDDEPGGLGERVRYRVRYNFTRAANGHHFTEWYDTLDEARAYVKLAHRFGELVIHGIEDADGEVVL